MKGSLIGVISDETVDFAVVTQTPSHGFDLWLSFLSPIGMDTAVNRGLHCLLTTGCSTTLVESPTYYQSYSPVLQALKMDIGCRDRLPFEDVLLSSTQTAPEVANRSKLDTVSSHNTQQTSADMECLANHQQDLNSDLDDGVYQQQLNSRFSERVVNCQLRA